MEQVTAREFKTWLRWEQQDRWTHPTEPRLEAYLRLVVHRVAQTMMEHPNQAKFEAETEKLDFTIGETDGKPWSDEELKKHADGQKALWKALLGNRGRWTEPTVTPDGD